MRPTGCEGAREPVPLGAVDGNRAKEVAAARAAAKAKVKAVDRAAAASAKRFRARVLAETGSLSDRMEKRPRAMPAAAPAPAIPAVELNMSHSSAPVQSPVSSAHDELVDVDDALNFITPKVGTGSAWSAPEVTPSTATGTAYEQLRADNMAKNRQKLAELGIPELKLPASPKPPPARRARGTRRSPEPKPAAAASPRRSARIAHNRDTKEGGEYYRRGEFRFDWLPEDITRLRTLLKDAYVDDPTSALMAEKWFDVVLESGDDLFAVLGDNYDAEGEDPDEDEDDEDSEEDAVPEAASEKEDAVPEEAASEKEDVDETKKKKKKPRARRGGGSRRSRRAALYDKWLAKLTPEQKDALDKLAEANAAELNKYKGLLPGKATDYVATRDATRDAERGLGEAPAATYEAERERVERERVQVVEQMRPLARAFLEKDKTAKGLVDKRPHLPEQLSQRLVAQLEAPKATRLAGERLELSAPRYGLSIGSFAPPPFHRGAAPPTPWGEPSNPSMHYVHTSLPKAAGLSSAKYRMQCGHFDIVPVLLWSTCDPQGFLEFVKKKDPDLYERMLVSNAHQFAHLVRSCGGFENVALLGLATRDIGEENIVTWWVRESYAHDPARAIFEELATSAEEFIGAVLFRYHPSNYLYPERTPSSVDGIKRNDLADSCFLSFVFGDKGKDGAIVSTTGIDAYLHDPGFAEAIALLRAAQLRLLHEQTRHSPSAAQVANWARFGETYWARGTNDRSPGQPWSKEEEAHLLVMAEKESREWTEILAADRKSPQPIFAHGRKARQLFDKHRSLIAAAARKKTPTKAKTSSARTRWTTSESEALAAGVKAHGASKYPYLFQTERRAIAAASKRVPPADPPTPITDKKFHPDRPNPNPRRQLGQDPQGSQVLDSPQGSQQHGPVRQVEVSHQGQDRQDPHQGQDSCQVSRRACAQVPRQVSRQEDPGQEGSHVDDPTQENSSYNGWPLAE